MGCASCVQSFGDNVEGFISGRFKRLGTAIGNHPKKTIVIAFLITALCGAGFMNWSTENRPDKLWVPQNTIAEQETNDYESYFASTSRFNQLIIRSATDGGNVLTKETLLQAMTLHESIANTMVNVTEELKEAVEKDDQSWGTIDPNATNASYQLNDVCTRASAQCYVVDSADLTDVCGCLISSILRMWNYNSALLDQDEDVLATMQNFGSKEDLEAALSGATFDGDGNIVSAEAFQVTYFLESRAKSGQFNDPINEEWEKEAFLDITEDVTTGETALQVDYFATRSFGDEFGGAITGDLLLVQISYAVIFIFLASNLGKVKPGPGSRWTMSFAALVTVGLSIGAGFGISSAFGLFYGPVHSLLPFILLGIGVDDAFVIVNAFDRERKSKRSSEDNSDLALRAGRALARAGASITVTSATDLVAFGISSSSSLPALASFCGYAAIGVFFLWLFASTFFAATLVIDEKRQRDNRRECLCCLTRSKPLDELDPEERQDGDGKGYDEGFLAKYFRNYHAPAILSIFGKIIVILIFGGLLGIGIWGAINLSVEDTQRAFIPSNSYVTGWLDTIDEYYPSNGIELTFVFEDGDAIYNARDSLSQLDSRLTGLSSEAPFIAEPSSETYRNVLQGLKSELDSNGSANLGNIALGDDNWPTSADDLSTMLKSFVFTKQGGIYARDLSLDNTTMALDAIQIKSEYVSLTKKKRGKTIDDSDNQIRAMDETRELVDSWTDLPSAFPYSEKFIAIEGFKIIRKELFLNVGLALAAVSVIVLITVASPVTAFIITINVAFCIVEILGFMHLLGIAIDSVSVINIVLAVGLSIDYSAHVGHCFMTKGGEDKNARALESLADIGSAVLSGALTTFLAVVVLLFSKSYVFVTLSIQFALTVGLGVTHGLVLLPVLLSILGPKAFTSANEDKEVAGVENDEEDVEGKVESKEKLEPQSDDKNKSSACVIM